MNPAKNFFTVLGLIAVLTLGTCLPKASAHVIESDNGVSAILHIKPDDNPVAGKPVPVNLLFSNDTGGFSLNHYKLKLMLIESGTVKVTKSVEPLFFGAATEGETIVTFPNADVYTLRIVGAPTDSNLSQFTLNYTVRVSGDGVAKKASGATPLILSGFSMIALVMGATKVIQSGGKYRQSKKLK